MPPDEQVQLEAWLALDTRHLGAFAQSRALMVSKASPAPMRATEQEGPPRRRVLLGGSIAAGLVAVLGAASYITRAMGEESYRA